MFWEARPKGFSQFGIGGLRHVEHPPGRRQIGDSFGVPNYDRMLRDILLIPVRLNFLSFSIGGLTRKISARLR